MPKRKDIQSILIIGSGPIVIGQACEFDYSGNQAVQALQEEGYRVIVHNPNPASVMTIAERADAVYMDPLDLEHLGDIVEKEKPDAILPTMGGQSALNLAIEFYEAKLVEKYKVEFIGASIDSIKLAEDRGLFKEKMAEIGLESPFSKLVKSEHEAFKIAETIGFPLIIRPSFTLGGQGGGIVYSKEELKNKIRRALDMSASHSALIEESLLGYQEFEFEVVRDAMDNALIVCGIENFDPMGIHTGDSITVAPIQTLADSEYQVLRKVAIDILRAVEVECGGSNVQLAFNPEKKRLLVIEMNPRVSRSSALASKATGFPIARCAAKLAVGFTLDEIVNEITGKTTAFFEPSIDYVAVKVPRFDIKKFTITELGTQMRSVGESLALARTFPEALNKALRAIEMGMEGLESLEGIENSVLEHMVNTLHPQRIFALYTLLLRDGDESIPHLQKHTHIHPWFLYQLSLIAKLECKLFEYRNAGTRSGSAFDNGEDSVGIGVDRIARTNHDDVAINNGKATNKYTLSKELLREAKQMAFSDRRIAKATGQSLAHIRALRDSFGIHACYHRVDTCAGEFTAQTPYYYSTYGELDEDEAIETPSLAILGSGPNRIGQGLEFDTCCTMMALALKEAGYKVVMINCNPETVSTDFNISDRLYIEPLNAEDVYEILRKERITKVVFQLGGQTPITLLADLEARGIEVMGGTSKAIHEAEDRELFSKLLHRVKLHQTPSISLDTTSTKASNSIIEAATSIGYPVLLRPSYVIGGQSMMVVYSDAELQRVLEANSTHLRGMSVLVDKFLEDAIEYDVDAISDGESVYIGGILEHIEHAGVHSGDSACVFEGRLEPTALNKAVCLATYTLASALGDGIKGFMNVQFALSENILYVLEVNPRASRTVPFISKASGVNLVEMAASVWMGKKLNTHSAFKANRLSAHFFDDNATISGSATDSTIGKEQQTLARIAIGTSIERFAVKEAVFSFDRFESVDPALKPEMRSTGESIGLGASFGEAFAKASASASSALPTRGTVFISIAKQWREQTLPIVDELLEFGFDFVGTRGTAKYLNSIGRTCRAINRVFDGSPHVIDEMQAQRIDFIVNILQSINEHAFNDDKDIRIATVRHHIPYVTTIRALHAALEGIRYVREARVQTRKLALR